MLITTFVDCRKRDSASPSQLSPNRVCFAKTPRKNAKHEGRPDFRGDREYAISPFAEVLGRNVSRSEDENWCAISGIFPSTITRSLTDIFRRANNVRGLAQSFRRLHTRPPVNFSQCAKFPSNYFCVVIRCTGRRRLFGRRTTQSE